MEHIFILKGLDCPNCSAKIEKEVGELAGVQLSSMNLMKQTLTVQAEASVTNLLDTVTTIVHSHEPDVEVSEKLTATVTKAFLLKGLDCPNCSAKIEKEVGELEGVAESTMNLMQQTLTVKAAPAVASTLLPQVETIVHSHEPDVEVSEKSEDTAAPQEQKKTSIFNAEDKKLTIRLFTGAVLYGIGMALTVFAKVSLPVELAFLIVAYVILGGDVVWQAVKNISRGQIFDEHFLMSLSTIGAFAIGEYPEAVAVMLFYQIGEFFQSLAVKRSRKSISDLMDIRPDVASVLRNGELRTVSPESIAVGETIVVKPGEKIPLDGTILDGSSMLDTKALTGESLPKEVQKGGRGSVRLHQSKRRSDHSGHKELRRVHCFQNYRSCGKCLRKKGTYREFHYDICPLLYACCCDSGCAAGTPAAHPHRRQLGGVAAQRFRVPDCFLPLRSGNLHSADLLRRNRRSLQARCPCQRQQLFGSTE